MSRMARYVSSYLIPPSTRDPSREILPGVPSLPLTSDLVEVKAGMTVRLEEADQILRWWWILTTQRRAIDSSPPMDPYCFLEDSIRISWKYWRRSTRTRRKRRMCRLDLPELKLDTEPGIVLDRPHIYIHARLYNRHYSHMQSFHSIYLRSRTPLVTKSASSKNGPRLERR